VLAGWIRERFQVATTRACELARFSRAAFYRKSQAKDQSALRLRIREIAHARPRFGYQRIHVMLRREGWAVNKKRIRRLYRLDGLQLRMRIPVQQMYPDARTTISQASATSTRGARTTC
jgi:hypothetical protein